MKPNRGAIRSIVAGLRAFTIISAGLFTLTALVFWQQTRLPDYPGGLGGTQTTGYGFQTPVGGDCSYIATTRYAKPHAENYPWQSEKVVDRAMAVQCTWSLGEESRLRLIVSRGYLQIAYCWFIPFDAPVTLGYRDLHLVRFYSGYAPDMHGLHSLVSDGSSTSLPPPPDLVGKGIRIHLLLVAFPFGVCAAVPLFRGPVRRWHRARRGLCVRCGYDLTGNISGVCSECGTWIPGAVPSSQAE